MKDRMKDKVIVVVVILLIGCALMTITSNQTAGKYQQELDLETYKRLTAEENISKLNVKIATLEAEVAASKDKIQSVQAILQEGQSQTSDLKTQLDGMVKTKEALEQKIEELKTASAVPVPVVPMEAALPEVAVVPLTPGQDQ